MEIKEIHIKHFRGIKELSLKMSDFTVLIGKNGVGKSSILHALNFFKEQKYALKVEDYHKKDLTQPIEVSLNFVNFNALERKEFQHYIHNDELKVIKIARGDSESEIPSASQKYHGLREVHPEFSNIRDQESKTEKKKMYNELRVREGYTTLPNIGRQSADLIEGFLTNWERDHPDALELKMDDGQFFGWPGVGAGKLGKYMEFFFIPAVHEYSEEEQEAGSDFLKELIRLTVKKTSTGSTALTQFKSETQDHYQQLIHQENEEKVRELGEELSSRLENFAPGCRIYINFQPGEVAFRPTRYGTELAEYGFRGPISFLGHGVQRSFFFTLLQYLGEKRFIDKIPVDRSEESEPVSDASTNETYLILLIIEEPELYQHPNRIRLIKNIFKDLAETPDDSLFQFQIICSSHSPHLINIQDFDNVRILRKIEENDLFKVIINEVNLQKIADRLKELYEFPKEKGFDTNTLISRLIAIMTPELSEGFFADKVVLVEGLEDKAVLLGLDQQLEGDGFDELGIQILPVFGKRNLDRPALIFQALDIPTYVLFDTDSDKSGKKLEDNKKTNKVLREIMGDTDIVNPLEQKIERNWASLGPNLTSVIKTSLGEDYYISEMRKLKEYYQFDKIKDCKKNYKVLEDFIKICYQNDKRLPDLEEIIQRIRDL